jgi:hypothetical protein
LSDLVIDYESLYTAAGDLTSLNDEIGTIKGGSRIGGYIPGTNGQEFLSEEMGPGGIGYALSDFYDNWSSPLHDAGDQITKLAATFKGVAQTFFDADAAQLAGINSGEALSAVRNYPSELASYNQNLAEWNKIKDPDNVQYYDINGNLQTMSVPKPTAPTAPGSSYSAVPGVTTTWTTGGTDPYDPSGGPLITGETSSYSIDGMNYSETTTFGPDQGWADGGATQNSVQTVNHSDGSTDTITTTQDTSGAGTSTDVNVNSGTTTTTVSTRANWNAPWVATPPPPPPDDDDYYD